MILKTLKYGTLGVTGVLSVIFVYIFSFYGDKELEKTYKFGVVFGAKVVNIDNKPHFSDALFDRTMTGINLFKAGKIENLVFSGGVDNSGFSEAKVMKNLALKHKVPENKIILDEVGNNTLATLKNAPKNSVLYISNDFHLSRINYFAKNYNHLEITNFDVFPAEYFNVRYTKEPFFVFREAMALVYYSIFH